METQFSFCFTHRLRERIQSRHQALEALPFSRALVAKCLPLAAYCAQLTAYWPVLCTLERLCAEGAAREPGLAAVWQEGFRRSPRLEQDLRFFQSWPPPTPVLAATNFVADLETFAVQQPLCLVGCLYVFEGSMLGARLLLPLLREMYQLQAENGCCYYAACETYPPGHWTDFKHSLENAARDPACEDFIIHGAQTGFQHIHQILTDILPHGAG